VAAHLIGLLLGLENDWPTAYETLLRRANLELVIGGARHTFETERLTIEPFSLRAPTRHRLIIDRLAWWYFHPREWLKKAALMNEVYLLNDPFTFQSMEKHTAYCAMLRLGFNIPETWLLPYKIGPDNPRYHGTAARYNRLFDLDRIAATIGYPLYMKPFDGGGWRGVTRINNREELHRAYDASGQSLMHLQAGIAEFDVFARSLTIGPQTRVMKYRPERPMHERYETTLDFMDPGLVEEVALHNHIVNAFFRWEFNSCEVIIKDGVTFPIDYANACPDVALVSLHVHFPWAILALARWSIFCAATARPMAIDMNKRDWFRIADRADLPSAERFRQYRRLTEEYFDSARFREFCHDHLSRLDEVAREYFAGGPGSEFDDLIVRSVRETFPEHEHDHYVGHFRALLREQPREQGQPAVARS
jgi:hypothetical protein